MNLDWAKSWHESAQPDMAHQSEPQKKARALVKKLIKSLVPISEPRTKLKRLAAMVIKRSEPIALYRSFRGTLAPDLSLIVFVPADLSIAGAAEWLRGLEFPHDMHVELILVAERPMMLRRCAHAWSARREHVHTSVFLIAKPGLESISLYNHAASYARGNFISFSRSIQDLSWRWLHNVYRRMSGDRFVGIVGSFPATSHDFTIRAELWAALRGLEKVYARWPRWAAADLDRRARAIGYRVECRPDPSAALGAKEPFKFSSIEFPPSRDGLSVFRWRWKKATRLAPPLTEKVSQKLVVYTAIAGAYDELNNQPAQARGRSEFVAFLDLQAKEINTDLLARGTHWSMRDLVPVDPDPCRAAKIYKMLPHLYFPDAEYSMWVDGTVDLVSPFEVERLIDLYLRDADFCLFRHYKRDCLYDEAEICLRMGLDRAELITTQIEKYRRDGYPAHVGLSEATVLLRRHTPEVCRFSEAWWNEVKYGSRRDQISFNYVARKFGLRYVEFPLTLYTGNGLFRKREHLVKR